MEQKFVTSDTKHDKSKDNKKKNISLWVAIGLIVVLIAVILWLWWQLMNCINHDSAVENEKKQLQSQVDTLQKQLADKGAATADTSTCKATVAQSLKDNIKDAINSKNTAALQGYMASSVKVVIAASEKGGSESAADAVTDLNYLMSATGPWNFDLPAPTITSYRGGFYGHDYFGVNAYVGKAASEQVVSFDFDSCGKINQIFMAASADLLL